MANSWIVDRNGVEQGPLTAQQLKTMAGCGQLRPSDLVRRDDATDWQLAGSVKGLFSAEPSPAARPALTGPSPGQADYFGVLANPVLIAVSAVFCLPIRLVLVWQNRGWSRSQKWKWTAGMSAIFAVLVTAGTALQIADGKTLAEADALWRWGDKGAAVAKYRSIMVRLHAEPQRLAYSPSHRFRV